MHLKVLRDALLVRPSNVSATHQPIVIQTIRSGLMGPYETVLAEVVALKLGELRFLQPGGYRSIAAHAYGIESPLVIRPMVERRHGGHMVGQSGPLSRARLNA
jgi:hypothetical protein